MIESISEHDAGHAVIGCKGGVKLLEQDPDLPDSETRKLYQIFWFCIGGNWFTLDAACFARMIFLRSSSSLRETVKLMSEIRNSKLFLVKWVTFFSRCFIYILPCIVDWKEIGKQFYFRSLMFRNNFQVATVPSKMLETLNGCRQITDSVSRLSYFNSIKFYEALASTSNV